MDVDFLVDVVLKQKFPLDLVSLKSAKTNLYTPLLRYSDCKGVYFANHGPEDPYEVIRAACAVPYFFGKRVELNGTEYVDGTISEQFGLRKVLELNPKNLLVILTRPPKNLPRFMFVRKILEFLWIRNESESVKKAIWDMPKNYEADRNKILELKEQMNIAIIQPEKELPVGRLGVNLSLLKKTIDQGYKDTINNAELNEFFKRCS